MNSLRGSHRRLALEDNLTDQVASNCRVSSQQTSPAIEEARPSTTSSELQMDANQTRTRKSNEVQADGFFSCPVCGEQSYVGIGTVKTCDACRAFYCRIRRGDVPVPKECKTRRKDCKISVRTRRHCAYCRLQRLYRIGLTKLSEEAISIQKKVRLSRLKRVGGDDDDDDGDVGDEDHDTNVRLCHVCGSSNLVGQNRKLCVDICKRCTSFLRERLSRERNWPTECKFGDNKCEIAFGSRHKCAYCRLEKMRSLGLMLDDLRGAQVDTDTTKYTTDGITCLTCGTRIHKDTCLYQGLILCWQCKKFACILRKTPRASWPSSRCLDGRNRCTLEPNKRLRCQTCLVQNMICMGVLAGDGSKKWRKTTSCRVCGHRRKLQQFRGLTSCLDCVEFVRGLERGPDSCWPTRCEKGDNKCRITKKTRDFCSYCRVRKIISLDMANHPLGEMPTGQQRPELLCEMCGDSNNCWLLRRLAVICSACRSFLRSMSYGWNEMPIRCTKGTNKCPVTKETRALCKFCRLQKFRSIVEKASQARNNETPAIKASSHGNTGTPLEEENNSSSTSKATNQTNEPDSCVVCDSTTRLCQHRGMLTCLPCRDHAMRAVHLVCWPKKCTNGSNKCTVTEKTRSKCKFCLFQKMISAGLIVGPKTGGSKRKMSQVSCQVCGVKQEKMEPFLKVLMCTSCKCFCAHLRRGRRWPTVCDNGQNQCSLAGKMARKSCKFCRLTKLKSLGLLSDVTNQIDSLDECCRVCGDIYKLGKRSNVTLCIACNEFIKNAISRGTKKSFRCCTSQEKQCEITKETRRKCLYCRVRKIRSLGILEVPFDDEDSERKCAACGAASRFSLKARRPLCASCREFRLDRIKGHCPWPTRCRTGLNVCKIDQETRKLCPYCRMQKILSAWPADRPQPPAERGPGSRETTTSSPRLDIGTTVDINERPMGKCHICHAQEKRFYKIGDTNLCRSCYYFTRHKYKRLLVCASNCELRRPFCNYCRLKKALSLGLASSLATSLADCIEMTSESAHGLGQLDDDHHDDDDDDDDETIILAESLDSSVGDAAMTCDENHAEDNHHDVDRGARDETCPETGPLSLPPLPASASTGPQQTSRCRKRKKRCRICDKATTRGVLLGNVHLCNGCHAFVRRKHKRVTVCLKKCRMRRPICRYCRLDKAVSLGLGPFSSTQLSDCIDVAQSTSHETSHTD